MSFTPGPWRVVAEPGDYFTTLTVMSPDFYIASIHEGLPGEDEGEANARLIAAAPDLYAALEDIASRGYQGMFDPHYRKLQDIARAARAKARGESA